MDIIWRLFEKTGDIKYFLLFKKLEVVNDETNNRRNCNK